MFPTILVMTLDYHVLLPVHLPGLLTVRPALVPVAPGLQVCPLAYRPAQAPGIPEDVPGV